MGETWRDLARQYCPDASDTELDSLLWEETAFPFAPRAMIETQLSDAAARRREGKRDG